MSKQLDDIRRDLEALKLTVEEMSARIDRLERLDWAQGTMFESTAAAPESPIVLEYPVTGPKGPTWRLRQKQVDEWSAIYPGIDVLAECRKAWGWCDSHPRERKTVRGMPAFLNAWLSRAQDRGPRPGNGTKQPHRPWSTFGSAMAGWICPHVEPCDAMMHCRLRAAQGKPTRPGVAFRLDANGVPREV